MESGNLNYISKQLVKFLKRNKENAEEMGDLKTRSSLTVEFLYLYLAYFP